MALILSGDTGVPASGMPTGSVIQTVQAINNTFGSMSSQTYADTGLTATITPISTTSKILITVSINLEARADSGGVYTNTQIVRGATVIFITERVALIDAGASTNSRIIGGSMASITYLDSPATTSPTTYKIQYALASTAANAVAYVNNSSNSSNGQSVITLQEIHG